MSKQRSNLSGPILDYLRIHPVSSSREIMDGLDRPFAFATIKRGIQTLLAEQLIEIQGKGKASRYSLNPAYELLANIDPQAYFQKEIDEREINARFNHTLITETLSGLSLFNAEEMNHLMALQGTFTENISKISDSEYNKEFERLAIDLSWKSSQIEGNTYSLLETERLLKELHTAAGKTKDEAVMLLNHKAALDFILEHKEYVQPMTISGIEDIHSILVKDLNVERGMRKSRVGISGTNYQPLDNAFQIKEAMGDLCGLVNSKTNVFEKALLVLLLISYIQPFVDGNKRTARIISNAILIHHHFCPLSFRTVDSIDYKKAMLIFYEKNNITAFKKLFLEQFEFAVRTYF